MPAALIWLIFALGLAAVVGFMLARLFSVAND